MSEILEKALELWTSKWNPRIEAGMSEDTLNRACSTLIETLNQVKNSCYKNIVKYVDKDARQGDSDDNLNIHIGDTRS